MHAQMIFAHVRALVGGTARVRGCGRPIQDRLSAGYPGAVCGFCSPPRSRSQTARAAACADVCGTAARGAAFLRFLALPMLDRLTDRLSSADKLSGAFCTRIRSFLTDKLSDKLSIWRCARACEGREEGTYSRRRRTLLLTLGTHKRPRIVEPRTTWLP